MSKCRFRVKEYPAECSDGIKLFILSNKKASMVHSNEKQPDLKLKHCSENYMEFCPNVQRKNSSQRAQLTKKPTSVLVKQETWKKKKIFKKAANQIFWARFNFDL